MKPGVTIRFAEARDVPEMAAIRAAEWGDPAYWIARIGGYLDGRYSPQLALAPRAAWVAVAGDRVVGFVAGHRTRRFGCNGELEWINVLAEHRGRDIAHQLMSAMLEWFAEQSAWYVCVNVAAENEPARRLYTRHGAVDLSPGWMVWRDVRQTLLGSAYGNS